jgi:hypothetical protein
MEEAADEAFPSSEEAVERADFTSALAFFFDFPDDFSDFEVEDFEEDFEEFFDFSGFLEVVLDFVPWAEEDEDEAELDELSAEDDEDEESDELSEEESCASEAEELVEESSSATPV